MNRNKIEVIRTYFDGSASNQHISSSSRDCFGAYVIGTIKYSYFKSENANTSNQAEYDALIKLLEEIHTIKDYKKKIWLIMGDSTIVIYQIPGIYKTNSPALLERQQKVFALLKDLKYELLHVSRTENKAGHVLQMLLDITRKHHKKICVNIGAHVCFDEITKIFNVALINWWKNYVSYYKKNFV
ncbi:MAG: hypothetical protein AABY22_15730 [Nanoarchaeota archaeon]